MPEQVYTVPELDDLRVVCRNKLVWGSYLGATHLFQKPKSQQTNEIFHQAEELVRIHMMAGHTAEDL